MILRCPDQPAWRTRSRRAGVLLEVLLSMALFVGAAGFTLAATRNVFSGLERMERDQFAADLARSKMAELDAGLVSLADLRAEQLQSVGSVDWTSDETLGRTSASDRRWIIDVRTQGSAFGDLSLVYLTVREDSEAEGAARFTLRQLVRLREIDPEAYEPDELMEDLPLPMAGERDEEEGSDSDGSAAENDPALPPLDVGEDGGSDEENEIDADEEESQ